MTTQQFYLISCFYLVVLVAAAVFTRATGRRIVGALVGGVGASVIALGAAGLGEKRGWWQMAIWGLPILPLVYVSFVVSLTPVYLVTWRVARRFGWRGLAMLTTVLTVIGPPRDYAIMARFPEWGSYAPGVAPVLAIAATYATVLITGHWLMRWVAGPAKTDRLARRPWEPV